MSDEQQFTRLTSSDVLAQCHVSPDSKFILLPVIKGTRITGWVVYNTHLGQQVKPDHDADGVDRHGVFARQYKAKRWVNQKYYS